MADLYIMCGVPGAGKTTLAKKLEVPKKVYISRDEIRFSLLKPNENYFSHEDEVKTILWGNISKNLDEGRNVIVDQTSLTRKSRKYLLDHVYGYNKVICIFVNTPLKRCLEQNEKRKGTPQYVPRGQIRRMHQQMEYPTNNEGFSKVIIVEGT